MSDHIEIRRRLHGIASVAEFERLLNSRILTDIDKKILRMHYIEGKPLSYIGDILWSRRLFPRRLPLTRLLS